MTDDTEQQEHPQAPNEDESGESETGQLPPAPWEEELNVYPLRDGAEDPRWALWVFWMWSVFCVGAIAFLILMTVLGWFYD